MKTATGTELLEIQGTGTNYLWIGSIYPEVTWEEADALWVEEEQETRLVSWVEGKGPTQVIWFNSKGDLPVGKIHVVRVAVAKLGGIAV